VTQIPQTTDAATTGDAPRLSHIFREFKGVYTRATRTAIPDEYFYNLENIIPIGDENAHVVPNISASLLDYAGDSIYWSQGVNLNGTEYLVNFATNGKVFFFNIGAGTSAQVNVGNLLSGSGSQCDQWKNTIILFIDSTGYYSYDGTTFAKITGAGVPTAGNSLAVYANRVWIVNARVLTVSALDDYTAAAFTAANGAATVNLTDPQIRSTVQRLKAQNGYLYLLSPTAINAISDVYVPTGASPPTPQFSNQNIQALIGTDQPASVFPYDRNMMFASRYGVHNLFGVSAPKVSGDIDGTWQYLDFSQAISGGQVVVQNILCGAFLLKRASDPVFGSNTVVALWYQRSELNQLGASAATDIWWFANYGALTFIVSGIKNNIPALFGFIGNKLYQLFGDTSTAPTVSIMTKLWPMEDEIARKECIVAGLEAFFYLYGSALTLSLDTENQSTALVVPSIAGGLWINAIGTQGQWVNNGAVLGGWNAPSTYLLPADAKGGFGHHVGLKLTSVGYSYELHLMALDYKLRDRWL
jgi:hypothetical protein